MATITESIDIAAVRVDHNPVVTGGIAGFFAGAMFGSMMSATSMMENVAAMIGMESIAAGWIVHFAISIFVALLYVGLVSNDRLGRYANQPSTGAGLGIVYGIILWITGVAFIMPLWLGIVTPATPPVPNVDWMSFVGHLIYGVFLGALYPLLLNYSQNSLDVPSEASNTDGSKVEVGNDPSLLETEVESSKPANVFSADSIRDRVANDEIPIALVLASTTIERILIEAIADEADIATEQVPQFCRGEGLDSYVQTASLLDLFGEHRALLQEIADHRNMMVQQTIEAYIDELNGNSPEREVILNSARFIEDVDS